MSPILESIGSVKGFGWGALLAGGPSFESIATVTPTGVSTVTFSDIPSTYKHLQLRMQSRQTGNGATYYMQFNNNSGASYAFHRLNGAAGSVFSSGSATTNQINFFGFYYGGSTTIPAVAIIDIHDYSSTTKNKTTRTFSGIDRNGTGEVVAASGLYVNTNAITSITIFHNSGNFETNSVISLYGIKG